MKKILMELKIQRRNLELLRMYLNNKIMLLTQKNQKLKKIIKIYQKKLINQKVKIYGKRINESP